MFRINQYNINRLRIFYAKRIGEVIGEIQRYRPDLARVTNIQILITHNMPAIKSRRNNLQVSTYYQWVKTLYILFKKQGLNQSKSTTIL